MRKILLGILTLAALGWTTQLATVTPAFAQSAIEDATAHPLVPLVSDAYITRDEFSDLAIVDLPSGPWDRDEYAEIITIEGSHRQLEYTIDGLETSLLRLYRSYLQHFEEAGLEVVFSEIGEELGARDGFTFMSRSNSLLARTPSTASGSNAYILARDAEERTYVALSFFTRQDARRIMVNVVEREEMPALEMLAADEPPVEEMPEVQAAEELESGLLADGRVVVNAILFAFDSDEILPESAEALAVVAGLMRDRPELKLLVVGHTDGIGDFDYNLRLSVARAASVVDWLTSRHGIDGARLRPAGAGPMSPITTNRSEEGRALNRRVELVEIID